MDWIMSPTMLRFNTSDQFATWLLEQPKSPSKPGKVYIFHLVDIDRTYIKIGDGRTVLIDLPTIQ